MANLNKRKLKVRECGLIDTLRKERSTAGKQKYYKFTQEQKDRRNQLARERYKNKNYKFGKSYRAKVGAEYWKLNKVYLKERRVKREYGEEYENTIMVYFYICLNMDYLMKSINQDIVNARGVQLSLKGKIKDHMYKLKIKDRSAHLSKKLIHTLGITPDEIAATAKKFQCN